MVPIHGDWKEFPKQWGRCVLAKSEVRKVLLWDKGVADNKDARDHVTQPAHFTDNKNSYCLLHTSSFLGNDLVAQQI